MILEAFRLKKYTDDTSHIGQWMDRRIGRSCVFTFSVVHWQSYCICWICDNRSNINVLAFQIAIHTLHLRWLSILFISLQWSKYQLKQLLKLLRHSYCIVLMKLDNNIPCLDHESFSITRSIDTNCGGTWTNRMTLSI